MPEPDFEAMTPEQVHAYLAGLSTEEMVEWLMNTENAFVVLERAGLTTPAPEDTHFVPVDEDGRVITSAEWVARAEAGRPMMVRMAHMPPDPDEETS